MDATHSLPFGKSLTFTSTPSKIMNTILNAGAMVLALQRRVRKEEQIV